LRYKYVYSGAVGLAWLAASATAKIPWSFRESENGAAVTNAMNIETYILVGLHNLVEWVVPFGALVTNVYRQFILVASLVFSCKKARKE